MWIIFVSAHLRKHCKGCDISNRFSLRLSSHTVALKICLLRTENIRNEYTVVLFVYYFNCVQGIGNKFRSFFSSVKWWISRDRNKIFMRTLSEDTGKCRFITYLGVPISSVNKQQWIIICPMLKQAGQCCVIKILLISRNDESD